MQNQITCNGCRSVLLYPRGASNVCCAVCNTITSISHSGTEMAQLVCGGCRTLLIYTRGAENVRCSRCNLINSSTTASRVAHVTCGRCRRILMYPYGASTVKCAVCHHITNVGMNNNSRLPLPSWRPNASTPLPTPVNVAPSNSMRQTVIVENPMSVDENGKLVSNVVVGVTTKKT
ncbi:protein LSD1-like isoform X2 [Ananas comosus]|uniref:Protein LOL3 n=1 Tax=Ananas comosus TaxID=4615 RepID=A0A199UI87_ANACO|nr:protein LSD1-like isoform X2 [Ananas comosus]OAY64416.1 Protein LOL3 [Ananas comosus]